MPNNRNFKRMPVKFEAVKQLDDEFDNVYKQLNLFSSEVVARDTSKDLFEIQKYNKLLKINKDTATLSDVIDFVATMASKLGELKAINVQVKK